jgi:excisionase family DNA binding protein
MFENYPDVVGVDALCKMLGGISAKLAYSILQQKKIPSIRIGREYKIAKTDVIAFVTQLSQRPSG